VASRKHGWGLPILVSVVASISSAAINIWTGLVPDVWKEWDYYVAVVTAVTIVLAVALALLTAWLQGRSETAPADPTTVIGVQNNNYGPLRTDQSTGPTAERATNLAPRNLTFTGRDDALDRIAREIGTGPVAIYGIGGVGKSSIALEYAHRGYAGERYRIVWWIRAESSLTLTEDLAALAAHVGIPETADQEAAVNGVLAALAGRDGWLLVFDNAPDADSVRRWLPPGRGHTLLTSRALRWDGTATRVEVTEFARAESLLYLSRRSSAEDAGAEMLADTLGDFPLALAQAAAQPRHRLAPPIRRDSQEAGGSPTAAALLLPGS
jgi:hypothetical protein